MTALVWLRRNLRLDDNRTLVSALKGSEYVIPIHLWDMERPTFGGINRLAFLIESLHDLRDQFVSSGSHLIIRSGKTHETLRQIIKDTGATRLYYDNNYERYEQERDAQCFAVARELGVECIGIKDNVLFETGEVRTGEGNPYTVYTPFKKNLWGRIKASAMCEAIPTALKPHPSITELDSYDLPTIEHYAPHSKTSPRRIQFGGAIEANRIWKTWQSKSIGGYRDDRNTLALASGTSKLSPHLKFGTISIRRMANDCLNIIDTSENKEGAETYLSELLWREFYYNILQSFPYVEERAFQKRYEMIAWEKNDVQLTAWKEGKTGVPIVDAAMRELLQTGFMHNRARMIVASFLTKDLLINWQEGEAHFMKYLTDGDIAQNNGGWQWSASTGTDAQPYYRIFNPYLQSKKFDPDGEYIKRYVPELSNLPLKFLHEPHLMTPFDQAEFGVELGTDYPFPIVEHYVQRDKAKALFEAMKENPK